jgi:hypothetical protein
MVVNYNKICLDGCAPKQIVNINDSAFNDLGNIVITNDCGDIYDMTKLEYAYSMDNVCWSCYMSYDEFNEVTAELNQDFYIRLKVAGSVGKILIDGEEHTNFSIQLDSNFSFSQQTFSSNLYNPYINSDCAVALYQNLTESISNMLGIPCYYFKLSPHATSKDITFKEYALMDVSSVKQIKIIIADNQMPSSRPEFSDFGLDWQTDWEVEVSKVMFATAFGNTVQPTEGDLIYIPMMKRMWMINGAWEEKKDAFMWNATTFKLTLVKYQEKDSVDLGDTESLVNSFVKNKYEDLFGDEENVGSGYDQVNNDYGYYNNLYQIFECDAIRKGVNIENIEIKENSTYFKGTLISDMQYIFNKPTENNYEIEYQKPFCSQNATISFIITPKEMIKFKNDLISIGNFKLYIEQNKTNTILYSPNIGNSSLTLNNNETYFIVIRWDKVLNYCEMLSASYTHNKSIPLYKLQNNHYYYDIDNSKRIVKKYNTELAIQNKSLVKIGSFNGFITNIKIFDIYVDDLSLILQMYPTHNHLLINDTSRKIVTTNGSRL